VVRLGGVELPGSAGLLGGVDLLGGVELPGWVGLLGLVELLGLAGRWEGAGR
jgi:hypothetical protein